MPPKNKPPMPITSNIAGPEGIPRADTAPISKTNPTSPTHSRNHNSPRVGPYLFAMVHPFCLPPWRFRFRPRKSLVTDVAAYCFGKGRPSVTALMIVCAAIGARIWWATVSRLHQLGFHGLQSRDLCIGQNQFCSHFQQPRRAMQLYRHLQ